MAASIADFGYMFYLQPLIMPMLASMGGGKQGARVLSLSAWLAVMGECASWRCVMGPPWLVCRIGVGCCAELVSCRLGLSGLSGKARVGRTNAHFSILEKGWA